MASRTVFAVSVQQHGQPQPLWLLSLVSTTDDFALAWLYSDRDEALRDAARHLSDRVTVCVVEFTLLALESTLVKKRKE